MKLPVVGIAFLCFYIVKVHAGTKSIYIKRLLNSAAKNSHIRRQDEVEIVQQQETEFSKNISLYSVNFAQCQSAFTTTNSTVSGAIAVFRLCPTTSAGDCSNCMNDYYGEYMIDLKTYVEATTEYFQAYHDTMCRTCRQSCDQSVTGEEEGDTSTTSIETANAGERRNLGGNKFYNIVPDCSVCIDECDKVENMETNGYVEATKYMECTKIYENMDNGTSLYAGPVCTNSGTKIVIGVYTDENCATLDETKNVNDYLFVNGTQVLISNLFLRHSYDDTCISCKEPVEQNGSTEQEDADDVTEMCEELHNKATGKCENTTDWSNDMYINNTESFINDNDDVCQHFASLLDNFYDNTKSPTSSPTIRAPINTTSTIPEPNAQNLTIPPTNEPLLLLPLLRVNTSAANKYHQWGNKSLFFGIIVVVVCTILVV